MNIKLHRPDPPAALLAALERKAHTDYSDLKTLFHLVCIGDGNFCGVAGDGGNAAYEWFTFIGGKLETSNCGYGSTESPLRDVLIKEIQ